MGTLRPNSNASFFTERLFGLGLGLFIASALLSKGEETRSALIGLIGAVIVISSTIVSILIKRKQVAYDRQVNVKELKK